MTKTNKRVLFWAPRILCILFALFTSIFSLDVFGEGYGLWKTIGAFVIHLIGTTGIVVVVLILAWRWEWIGTVLFIGLGIFYLIWTWGRFPLIVYVTISGPLFLVGLLFAVNWRYKSELQNQY